MTKPYCKSSGFKSLALVLALVATALAQDDPSGALSALQNPPKIADSLPPGLDDAFVPIDDQTTLGNAMPDVRDSSKGTAPSAEPIALWELLIKLDANQRANAVIELELGRRAGIADRDEAAEIAALWNSGLYDDALARLEELEKSGAPLSLGIAWKIPQEPGTFRMNDVRIGGTRSEAQTMNMDFDVQNGYLFMIVRWGSTDGTSAWTMNLSIDDGATWSETYAYNSSVGLIDVDCVVVDDYVYVAYVAGNAADEARLRRCLVNTGGIDGSFGFQTIFDAGANTIEEVALAANADDYDNRIYYAAIQSDDTLRWAWDAGNDGATFSEYSPVGAAPEFGLDTTFDNHFNTCTDYVYISYAGNDGNIHVLGRHENAWNNWTVETGTGSFRTTAISAYESTIICAFEYPYTNGTGIRYRISYDCGETWTPGSLAIPDGSTIFGYFEPDVDARNGIGTAIVYQAEAGEYDPMYYRNRVGFQPGGWSDPALFNDHDVYTGSDTAIAYLPPVGSEVFSHGAAYLSLDPDFRTLYFDRPVTTGAPCNDTTPPLVDITLPVSFHCACDSIEIIGSVSDPDGAYAGDRLEYRPSDSATWTIADTAIGARSGLLYIWNTSALSQGYYYVRVVGQNECALSAGDDTLIYKAMSFDNLDMRAPTAGVHGGIVCFDGTASTQSCFDHYTVDYRPSGGGTWNPVDPTNTTYYSPVTNDPLASWYTTTGAAAVPDGEYQVRLMGTTACGDSRTITRTIRIDNTAPVATITAPTACEHVAGPIILYGTANDANLDAWTLEYTAGGSGDWTVIASDDTPVVDGLLGVWDTAGLPHCAYTLRLMVKDTANVSCSGPAHQTVYYLPVMVGCPEDIDGDGEVDLADLADLLGAYGSICPQRPSRHRPNKK